MAENRESETSQPEISREKEVESLQRLDGGEFALVDDEHDSPGYLTSVEQDGRIYVACVTHHTEIEIADSELIPNGLFRDFLSDGVEWIENDDVPELVTSEVNRLAA